MLRGEERWLVDHVVDGKRRRPSFATEAAANGFADDLKRGRSSAKAIWKRLSPTERDEIILAWHSSKENGHDVYDLLHRAKDLQPHTGPTLIKVIDEMVSAKTNAGRSEDYAAALEGVCKQFADGRESRKFDALTVEDVEAFLNSKTIASRTTLRSRLSTLFKFGIRKRYRPDNPCAEIEPITRTLPPPRVFTLEQFMTATKWLLNNARHGLAWWALSSVCGLRPEEAEKTDKKRDINFDEGFVKVEAQTTKVRQRRVVYPKPEAMAFLKWAIKNGGRLPLNSATRSYIISGQARKHVGEKRTARWRTRSLREALGLNAWPKDITRHTAASYWLAGKGETVRHVAKMLGHSEHVCETKYKALKTAKEAGEFWESVLALATGK